jgi:predicted transcriptional regulator
MTDEDALSDLEHEVYTNVVEHGRLSQEEIARQVGDRSHVEIISAVRRLQQKDYLIHDDDEDVWSANPERTQ